ncbi:MAG TPA: tRNA (adenosine(37)-N6)-methyltransferase TrmM [Bacteroidales bacterium]|jgi:tRNA1Val (adenine37-N6)-methyltransferase|nr:tRNA (adenosine(37)-N6)-methyltransferase TrmM [Bacteroidales bacterium]
MSNQSFRFKQFSVRQEKSAMKVGTDGVMLGAWTSIGDANRILDIGTGTGLIALMLAQRCDAKIDAVEVDEPSAQQAEENVVNSKWGNRINIICSSFQSFAKETNEKYDLIVSNPPYFVNSLKSPEVARTVARHNELLPHDELIEGINTILTENGRFAGIFPYIEGNVFVAKASNYGLFCTKRVNVLGKVNGPVKRLLLEFERKPKPLAEETLCIRADNDKYTAEYIQLTKDFYLAF